MGHTAVYDPTVRSIYVFGGSKNKRWFSDVHVLDIDEWKWQLIKVKFHTYYRFITAQNAVLTEVFSIADQGYGIT